MAHDHAFLICENKCLVPGYTAEQIDALLRRGSVSLIDKNTGEEYSLWVGTTAEYNAIAIKDPHTIYYKTDDDTVPSAQHATSATTATYSEKDPSGLKFIDHYLHEDGGYEGDAINGVTIYGKNSDSGGSYFLPVWKSSVRNICFGVMWWDGETNTVSSVSNRLSGKRYAVKITMTTEGYDGDYNEGLAKIVQYNDDGTEETLSIQGTTLELKNLSELYRQE